MTHFYFNLVFSKTYVSPMNMETKHQKTELHELMTQKVVQWLSPFFSLGFCNGFFNDTIACNPLSPDVFLAFLCVLCEALPFPMGIVRNAKPRFLALRFSRKPRFRRFCVVGKTVSPRKNTVFLHEMWLWGRSTSRKVRRGS